MQFNFNMDTSELFRRLAENMSPAKMGEVAAKAVNEAILVGQELVVNDTPVGSYETPDGRRRGGHLRNSIDVDLATATEPAGRIFTTVDYAPAVEWGTGVHGEAPGAPRAPITIKAKNPRQITYTRNGKTITVTVVALAWWSGGGRTAKKGAGGWNVAQEVTIQGQKPAAMFRKNLPAIRARLVEALQRHAQAAMDGD